MMSNNHSVASLSSVGRKSVGQVSKGGKRTPKGKGLDDELLDWHHPIDDNKDY